MNQNAHLQRSARFDSSIALGLLVLALVLGACSPFSSGRESPIQTYMFTPRQFEQFIGLDAEIVLLVGPVQSAGYDSRNMTYTRRPYEHTYYVYSQWAEAPPRLIEPLLAQAMESSGRFAGVIDIASSVVADIRMDTHLLVLQHEFHTEPSQGRIVLHVQITDLHRRKVLATRIFESVQPAPTDDPYGGVVALNLALENVLYEITLFCGAIVDNWEPPYPL